MLHLLSDCSKPPHGISSETFPRKHIYPFYLAWEQLCGVDTLRSSPQIFNHSWFMHLNNNVTYCEAAVTMRKRMSWKLLYEQLV